MPSYLPPTASSDHIAYLHLPTLTHTQHQLLLLLLLLLLAPDDPDMHFGEDSTTRPLDHHSSRLVSSRLGLAA
ncbi:hypothetical protein CIB48_g3980 [Xylaria polymorpha]|nr:hypothetical protein CIB48_g3980 [Xylaria polymorpha]